MLSSLYFLLILTAPLICPSRGFFCFLNTSKLNSTLSSTPSCSLLMCFSIQLFLFLLFISSRCSRLLRCKFLADCLLLFVSYWKLQQIFRSDRHTLGPEIKQLNYIFYSLCFIPLNLRIFTFEIKQVTIHTSKINSMYTDFQRGHLCWLNWGIYYVCLFVPMHIYLWSYYVCLFVSCLSPANTTALFIFYNSNSLGILGLGRYVYS